MSQPQLALTQYAHGEQGNKNLTMAVLGCGSMGIAILSGILDSLSNLSAPKPLQQCPSSSCLSGSASGSTSGPNHSSNSSHGQTEIVPPRLPSKFIACVRCPQSAKRVKSALWAHSSDVKVVQNNNVASVTQADVIILACKPNCVGPLLAEPGLSRALHGKLLVSICAGVTVPQLELALHGAVPAHAPDVDGRCTIVRAMPNIASRICESMTVIANSTPPLPPATHALVAWIFRRIGDVVYLPPSGMDASTALCGSGPAFFSLMLEAAIDGAVAMGLPREEATRLAAQTMKGTAALVQDGLHPALLRESICTPAGCTIGGVLTLEEKGVRGSVSQAIKEATVVASQQGRGGEQQHARHAANGGYGMP